jgi:hypothetical protein
VITSLRFKREPSGVCDGRFVREARFERVTDLQLSTVCLAANRARDQLSLLLGRELTLDVFAPSLVRNHSGDVLFSDGIFYGASGSICDAYIVFRDRDGHRLAASAFGEDCNDRSGPLSALEERALERIANEIARLCGPFCGDVAKVKRGSLEEPPVCVTYFELRITAPLDAVIGIGLSKDPGPAFGTTIDRPTLAGVTLEVRAEFGQARLDAIAVARWAVGTIVRLDTKIGAPTTLKVGKIAIATGDCGIRAQSNAVAITSTALSDAKAPAAASDASGISKEAAR